MKLMIVFNKRTGLYKVKLKDCDIEGEYSRVFNALIISEYNKIRSMNCYIKHGEICSYNLEPVRKVKKHLDSILMIKKLRNEI